MPKSKLFVAFFTFIGVFLLAAAVYAEIVTVDVDATINTANVSMGRIFRDGIPSDCGGKAYPGVFNPSTAYGYDEYGPYTAMTTGCVTVNFDPNVATLNNCFVNAHAQAFLNSFDPNWGSDNATNFLGDVGSSDTLPFSFPINAGDTFVIVVTNTAASAPCDYHFDFTYDLVPEGPVAGPGCTLPVPEGSVVGDLPFETQLYYEPGNASPGLVLNPGTYIVTGQDASETYYQIVLACQFVWVPKSAMQPSYQEPQNGAPLPTRIIDGGSSSGDAATGSANDM